MLRRRTARIRIGPGFQAMLPQDAEADAVVETVEVWSGSRAPPDLDVEGFLRRAKTLVVKPGLHVLPADDGVYLGFLHDAGYDVAAVIEKFLTLPGVVESAWQPREIADLDAALAKHDDDLRRVAPSVPDKTFGQVVAFVSRARRDLGHRQPGLSRAQPRPAKRPRDLDLALNLNHPADCYKVCKLFLDAASKELDPTTFNSFLHFLRLFDQRIIARQALAAQVSRLLQHHPKVRDAFQFFILVPQQQEQHQHPPPQQHHQPRPPPECGSTSTPPRPLAPLPPPVDNASAAAAALPSAPPPAAAAAPLPPR
ncbi:hypothetical protein CTAYLR_002723 [Chrysophaeum taylorii]|uniref:Histone deacetylase interacting domain-containing protein n=1 Tax=Chrysophaeum taylorii TaxID=2483200 RepID=A0AAD7UDY5_9STRA|nr:hypothetical protein CTAYLR_002723 [Chrysophaeum taylorii]